MAEGAMVVRCTVGPKGQVTTPKEFREKYHLLECEDVVIVGSVERRSHRALTNISAGQTKR
jgi:bifunctional DNA-binding transcriptional regulator/antitoxin component of YhaV-PrlF toxin-antitoxin module